MRESYITKLRSQKFYKFIDVRVVANIAGEIIPISQSGNYLNQSDIIL